MRITDRYVFFWRDFLGNWSKSPFVYVMGGEKLHFNSVEQFFMYMKAYTFGDKEQMKNILETDSPKEAKDFGRKVKNYKEEVWAKERLEIMKLGIYLKFVHNKKLRDLFLSRDFDNKEFVEASPKDVIWGVGLGEDNPLIDDFRNWKGENLMGRALDEVRERIIEEIYNNELSL